MISTAPEVTVKLSEVKEATPLFEVVASSPSILMELLSTMVLIPSPAKKSKLSSK